MTEEKALTIFNPDTELLDELGKRRREAIKRFISGITPRRFIKYREGGKTGIKDIPYVTGSYLIRQVGLVTGFKWSHEVINRRTLPDWWKAVEGIQASKKESYTKEEVIDLLGRIIRSIPREIISEVKVTVYDAQDRAFVHTSTGVNQVKYLTSRPTVPVSIGNAEKASETDGIKKALANLGFCPDVYGPKEDIEIIDEEGVE